MTLFDCSLHSCGTVTAIGGDGQTHRRLVDLGLLGATYRVRAKNARLMLVDFGAVSAVVEARIAANIEILEGLHENSVMRKP